MPRQYRLRRIADERRAPRQQLVRQHADRIDVGPVIDVRVARHLLRRHVLRRPEEHAVARERQRSRRRRQGPRYPEVAHQRVTTGDQDVVGLDVAVDDALGVRIRERVADVPEDHEDMIHRYCTTMHEPMPQRMTRLVRHHVIQQLTSFARIVQRHDVRMTELRDDLDLPQESRPA